MQEKQPAIEQKSQRVELSLRENYALCDFLMKRQPIAGESFPDIAAEANRALDSNRINRYHVQSRFEALDLKLKPANGSDADRIAELEKQVARLAVLLANILTGKSTNPVTLAILADEFGVGQ